MRECVDEGILQSYFDDELSSELRESVAAHLASCISCARAAREMESENLLLSEALEPEFAVGVPTERLRHRIDAAIAGLHVVSPARSGFASNAGGSVRRWVQSVADLFTLSPQRAFGYAGLVAILVFATVFAWVHFKQGSSDNELAKAQKDVPSVPAGSPKTSPEASPTPSPSKVPGVTPPQHRPGKPAERPSVNPNESFARVKLLPGERSYLKTIASLDTTIKSEGNPRMRPALQAEYERNLALVDRAIAATRSAAKNNPNDPDTAEFMFSAYQSKVDLLNQVADARLSNRPH
jgi:hypothetical protein